MSHTDIDRYFAATNSETIIYASAPTARRSGVGYCKECVTQ
jgi:hypothetical protein